MSERTARPHTQRVVSAIRYIYKSKITILPPPPPSSPSGAATIAIVGIVAIVVATAPASGGEGGAVMNVCSATISAAPGIVHRAAGPAKPFHAHGDIARAMPLSSRCRRPLAIRSHRQINFGIDFKGASPPTWPIYEFFRNERYYRCPARLFERSEDACCSQRRRERAKNSGINSAKR